MDKSSGHEGEDSSNCLNRYVSVEIHVGEEIYSTFRYIYIYIYRVKKCNKRNKGETKWQSIRVWKEFHSCNRICGVQLFSTVSANLEILFSSREFELFQVFSTGEINLCYFQVA